MISISQLTKYYQKEPLFNKFDLKIFAKKVCIQAPNGRGKSTLFRLVAGLEPNFSGGIEVFGVKENRQKLVALASDGIIFPEFLTAKHVLELTSGTWDAKWPAELIDSFHFTPFLQTRVNKLSSGNYKKLQLINAMMRNTPVLILDEPSAALDSDGLAYLLEWCSKFDGQLVISCHEPEPFVQIGFTLQPLDGETR